MLVASTTERCWQHLTPEERETARWATEQGDELAEAMRRVALQVDPACWAWPVPDDTVRKLRRWREPRGELTAAQHAMLLVDAVQLYDRGRCAICGVAGAYCVEDHDHQTGRVRGRLCRPCNVTEGLHPGDGDSVYARYRRRPPYAILGVEELYTGFGWESGKPIEEGRDG